MESPIAGKSIRCKAAVCRSAGAPLVIEEVVVSPPAAHEARVRIICTSLCHSDVTFWSSPEFATFFPRILGHEAYGVVESVGEGVEAVAPGDAVVPVFLPSCEGCVDCRSARSNLCSEVPFTLAPGMPRRGDGASRFVDAAGAAVHNFAGVSSFAEYTVVDVSQLVKVDPAMPPAKACLLSCGISTGVGAAWRVAGVEKGSTVAIFGLGSVGLAVAEGATLCGAGKIIGVDLNPDKFVIGKKFGLTDFVNPNDTGGKSVSQVIKEMTDGGADYCFECIGLAPLMNDAFQSSRKGWGKTIIVGVEMHGKPLSVDVFELLSGRQILGTLFGGLKPKTDVPVLATKYLNKELHLDEFITHEIGFHDINKAFDLLLEGKSLRCTIWLDENIWNMEKEKQI